MRDAMVRGLARWGVLSLAGSAVVAVPDSGPPIVPFSRTHGPSLVDAVGVVLLLVGWAAFLLPLWRYRRAISHRGLLVAAVTIGAALLGWSVATDTGMWWVGGRRPRAGRRPGGCRHLGHPTGAGTRWCAVGARWNAHTDIRRRAVKAPACLHDPPGTSAGWTAAARRAPS